MFLVVTLILGILRGGNQLRRTAVQTRHSRLYGTSTKKSSTKPEPKWNRSGTSPFPNVELQVITKQWAIDTSGQRLRRCRLNEHPQTTESLQRTIHDVRKRQPLPGKRRLGKNFAAATWNGKMYIIKRTTHMGHAWCRSNIRSRIDTHLATWPSLAWLI